MKRDETILELLSVGRLLVDAEQGRVYSSRRPGRPLGRLTRKGYLVTSMQHLGREFDFFVHRVICIAAHGPPPTDAHQVNHRNTVKQDNRACNLEWATAKENTVHARDLGLFGDRRGERAANARLTNEDVLEIRRLVAAGETKSGVARRFGVSHTHVMDIVSGKFWSHLPIGGSGRSPTTRPERQNNE